MSAWLRRSLYSSFGLLWLSGCAWLVLHFFFQDVGDFGAAPHPWQPRLMVAHGVLAVVAIFFVGWIAGTHIGAHWKRGSRRVSGMTLIALIALLALTGLASYYLTSEPLRSGSSLVHETAGAFALLPALIHWFVRRRIN